MSSELGNQLHYTKLDQDPTLEHVKIISVWATKWLKEGEFDDKIAVYCMTSSAKHTTLCGFPLLLVICES